MKNTGVVRKIDELGRIVIPKELRKVLKISSGDDLEILVENNQIILKKYSQMQNIKDEGNKLIASLNNLIDSHIFITDKDQVITRGVLEKQEIPPMYQQLLQDRKAYVSKQKEEVNFSNTKLTGYFIVEPIIQNSDANGLVVLYKENMLTSEDKFFAKVFKNLIENK